MSSVVVPNESKQGELRSLLIAMIALPTIIVAVRLWSRYLSSAMSMSKALSRFWWDDWTALAAALINIAVCGIGLYLVDLGMGKHIQVVPPNNLEPFLKLLWVEYYLFDAGTAIAKSSALFFYTRVFSTANRWLKYSIWLAHAMNVTWLLGIILSVIFECTPIEKAWNVAVPGKCVNTQALWLGSGITSLVIDVFILLMPVPGLWRLQMKTMRKVQVVFVFLCGYMVVVVSIGRLVTIVQAGADLQLDPTYRIATPVLWLGSEISISVTSVSLPSLLFLARRAHKNGMWSLISTRGTTSRSRLANTNGSQSNEITKDDESTNSAKTSAKYFNKFLVNSSTNGVTATEHPGLADDDSLHKLAPGIHVRNDFSVEMGTVQNSKV